MVRDAIGNAFRALNRSALVFAYALVGAAALALALIDLVLVLEPTSPWPTWLLISLPVFGLT